MQTQLGCGAPVVWVFAVSLLPVSLGIIIALYVAARTTHVPSSETIDIYAKGESVILHGIIVDEPDRRPLSTKYTVEVDHAPDTEVNGRVLITDHRGFPDFFYGDEVIVKGKLEKPGQIGDFYYDRYLSLRDIYSVIYRGTLEHVSSRHGNPLFAFLYGVKARFELQINRIFPEPHASFLAGLLTGSRKGIPEHLLNDFNTVGLTHIIAISGYNITIILNLIAAMLFFIPLKWRFVPAISIIILFTLFVGASASVVRAAIMGILGLIALQTNRLRETRLAILWTLFFMLLWNPKYLWYDAGFQLSFLAVIGIVEISPFFKERMAWLPSTLGIRESFLTTIAAQIFAVPWIITLFGRLSLIAPLSNVLIAPFVPLAMLFGFVGTVVSFVWFFGGQLIGYVAWGCMTLIILIAKGLSHIPYSSLQVPQMDWMLMVGYYLFLICIFYWCRHQTETLKNK